MCEQFRPRLASEYGILQFLVFDEEQDRFLAVGCTADGQLHAFSLVRVGRLDRRDTRQPLLNPGRFTISQEWWGWSGAGSGGQSRR